MTQPDEPKSEATFEADIAAALKAALPASSLAISHQVQFTLRLGHHEKEVDGRKGWSKGRLDVLLSSAAGHAAILELKREDLDLTDDDRDQGLSYARLLQPMAPLVIVTNGRRTRFYTTVDGEEWVPKAFTEEVFSFLVRSAASRAATRRDEAIRSLLASDPAVWADIVRAFTKDAIVRRSGEVDEFGAAIARGFSVRRFAGTRLLNRLRNGAPVLALVGPPLSGKTNVLMQCCEQLATGPLVPLYIDASSTNQGPFNLLASLFVKHLFAASTLAEVRQWLSTSLRATGGDTRLVLLLDDVMPELTEQWLGDLDELLVLARVSPLSLVMALDPNTLVALSRRPSRSTKTEFGRSREVVQLGPLSDKEFESAVEALLETARITPYMGAQYNVEYREPRVLRVIAASARRQGGAGEDMVLKFSSTTTAQEVDLAWNAFVRVNHELLGDLRALARAYFEDLAARSDDDDLALLPATTAMRRSVAAKLMPADSLSRLVERSFVSSRLGPDEDVLLLPRHPELFARAAALELGAGVAGADSLAASYKMLMSRSDMLPLGDIVGALALREVARRDPQRFDGLVNQAVKDLPHTEHLPAGTVLEVSLFGGPLGEIQLPDAAAAIGNLHPWLVLAQLAIFPLGGGAKTVSPNAWIMSTVGAFPGFLRRDRGAADNSPGFHFHEVDGRGAVPCVENGVVEPIGQAMIRGFHARPDEMTSMAAHAVAKDEFHLMWRLSIAAREMASSTDKAAASAAQEVVAIADGYFGRDLEAHLRRSTPAVDDATSRDDEAGRAVAAPPDSAAERRRRRNERKRQRQKQAGKR